MIKKKNYIKIVLVNALLIVSTLCSYAGTEVLTSRLQGTNFDDVATLIVKDDKFNLLPITPGLVNKNVVNTVTLGIDPSSSIFHNNPFTIVVTVDVNYLDENFSSYSLGTKTLTVDYDPGNGTSYLDKDVLTFEGGHYVEVKVISITDGVNPLSIAPDDIFLDASMEIERYYDFNSQIIPDFNKIQHQLVHANSRELTVTWDNIEGAEEYDLEWTWVNNYDVINGGTLATTDLSYDFKNNATRVRLAETKYNIPLVYERGWILYRYRAIGRAGVDFTIPVEGVWSTEDASVPEKSGDLSLYAAINRYEVLPHNNDEINWQYSATFAENGKQSTAVSYYDGTLRNRQSVAKLNTENKVIAGSVLYDYQGRPAVNVLPSPIYKDPLNTDPSSEQLSGYIESLNVSFTSGSSYHKDDFDLDPGASCVLTLNKMNSSTSKGAANYYSDQNLDQEGAQAFLPDAFGYPFVQTEYTNDQTGRVRRQGGLGQTHQLATDHETKYFYGQPEQPEIDVLFGNEAGLANHYKKNAVLDANGQVSVSYIDMHDRVVATALAGQAPNDKVIPLSSNVAPQSLVSPLIGFNSPSPDNKALEVNRDILVTAVGDYTFDYSFTTEDYTDCLPAGICFDCIYEVTISIKDECGDDLEYDDGSGGTISFPITTVVGNITPFDTDCAATPITYNTNPGTLTVNFPKVGTYSLHKELRVSQQPLNFYIQEFIENNTCTPSLQSFLDIELAGLDFSGCNISPCDYECLLIYPKLELYQVDFPSAVQTDYDAWLLNCVDDCKNDIKDPCDLMLKQMKLDFYPGGQYAEIDFDASGNIIDQYSIFHLSPTSPILNYTQISYLDNSGNQIFTTDLNGNQVTPDQLSLGDFISLFDPSWLDAMVQLHPEYCSYTFCTNNQAAYDFIEDFKMTNTFEEACMKGYLNPMGLAVGNTYLSSGSGSTPNCQNSTNIDEFFLSSTGTTASSTPPLNAPIVDMTSYINDIGGGSPTINMWQAAIIASVCSSTPNDPACYNNVIIGDPNCNNVDIWNAFKALYYAKWLELMDGVRTNANLNLCYIAPPASKLERFPDFGGLFSSSPTPTPASVTADVTLLATTTCGLLAANWMDDLAGCYASLPGGETWDPGQPTYDDILQSFIDVCVDGSLDNNFSPSVLVHPMGTTSTPNTITITNTTTSATMGVSDLDGVLEFFLGASYENNLCSPLLITGTQGHTSQLNNLGVIDNCGCDIVLETEAEYATLLASSLLPTGVNSASDLLVHNLGISVSDFEKLACKCNEAKTNWTQGSTWLQVEIDAIVNEQLYTSPMLQCETCIPCDDYDQAVLDFAGLYPTFVGSSNYNELLATFLNQQFDVDFVTQNYQDFEALCVSGGGSSTCVENSTNLSNMVDLFVFLYNQANNTGSYIINSTLSDLPVFNYLSPLLTSCNYTLNTKVLISIVNTSGGNHTINLTTIGQGNPVDECQIDCNISFTLPVGLKFTDVDFFAIEANCDVGQNVFTIQGGAPSPFFNISFQGTTDCFDLCDCEGLCYSPIITPEDPVVDPCIAELISQAEYNAQILWQQQMNAGVADFIAGYFAKCMTAQETFNMTFNAQDHHYTLYYYDQAGNLTQTVPPKGVDKLTSTTAVVDHRDDPIANPTAVFPVHTLQTTYKYNAYNQVVEQTTPDGGTTIYFYDNIGRLVTSQNLKQANSQPTLYQYSYSKYDIHGRIIEVGEIINSVQMISSIAQSASNFATWVDDPTATKSQVTKTFYDEELSTVIANEFDNQTQENLRNRIASVTFQEVYSTNPNAYDNATHYSYDEHGNVITSVQENRRLAIVQNDFKRTDYTYELISGNIIEVSYQKGEADQFFHKYCYDADNRLFEVLTSRDHIIWDRDAKYKYYQHGPLARTETGDLQVQGTDYAYTLQGWLKGVNSNTLVEDRDMGKDGIKDNTVNPYMTIEVNQHALMGRDAYGFSLDYFMGDYAAISVPPTTTDFLAEITTNSPYEQRARRDLFNGNITGMTNAITKPDGNKMDINGYAYQYDQLNRLKQMDAYTGSIGANNDFSGAAITTDYFVSLDYDDNGNITDLTRNAYSTGVSGLNMDDMVYTYTTGMNRLDFVYDDITGSQYNDIKAGQVTGNYEYTDIGELKHDEAEQIEDIEWTVYGKVKKVTRTDDPVTSPATKPSDLEFVYGPSGQRILKIEKPREISGALKDQEYWKYSYYSYDASGNLMATYNKEYEVGAVWTDINVKFKLNEHPIYGSSRLGLANEDIKLFDQDFTISGHNSDNLFITVHGSETTPIIALVDETYTSRTLGRKMYELSNHLGNVQVVVSDRKRSTEDGGTGIIDYYTADVVSASDYYPFGSLMPNRYFSSANYRFGFNGMEMDNEMKGVTGASYTTYFRQYDPRLGRWMSKDVVNYSWQSPYASFNNNPIYYADPSGAEGENKEKRKAKRAANKAARRAAKVAKNDGLWQAKDKDGYTGEVVDFDIEEIKVIEYKNEIIPNPQDNTRVIVNRNVGSKSRPGPYQKTIWDMLRDIDNMMNGGLHIWGSENNPSFALKHRGKGNRDTPEFDFGKFMELIDQTSKAIDRADKIGKTKSLIDNLEGLKKKLDELSKELEKMTSEEDIIAKFESLQEEIHKMDLPPLDYETQVEFFGAQPNGTDSIVIDGVLFKRNFFDGDTLINNWFENAKPPFTEGWNTPSNSKMQYYNLLNK